MPVRTRSWPIVSIANIVRHTKRLTVPRVGLIEEADIYAFFGKKPDKFLLLTAHAIGVPVRRRNVLPLSVLLGRAAIMGDVGNDLV